MLFVAYNYIKRRLQSKRLQYKLKICF